MSKNEHALAKLSGAKPVTKSNPTSKPHPDNGRPWVGSYFGIPEPELPPMSELTSYSTIECEIEILYRNLSVKKYTISHQKGNFL